MKKVIVLVTVILVLTGAGLGVYFYLSNQKNSNTQNEVAEIDPVELIVFEVQEEGLSEFQKNREFERFSRAKNIILSNVDKGMAVDNDSNFYAWLEIALAQKIVGDYDRAIAIWKWFTAAYPHNSTSPANLASTYTSLVIDNQQAEKYYIIAIEREKHKFYIYYNFYKLYRYNFEDAQKAIDVLKMGLENNSDNKNFVNELIDYLIVLDKKNEAEDIIDEWVIGHPEDYSLKAKLN